MSESTVELLQTALDEVQDEYIEDAEGAKRFTIELRICMMAWIFAAFLVLLMFQCYDHAEPMGVSFSELKKSDLFVEKGNVKIDFIVFEDGIYTKTEGATWREAVVGNRIGTVEGCLDATTPFKQYTNLTGTVSGEVYGVEGYSLFFLLALKQEDGYTFFLRNTDTILRSGADVLEKLARIPEYGSGVSYRTKEGTIYPYDIIHVESVTAFYEEALRALWLKESDVAGQIGEEIGWICFQMGDTVPVELRCYEGGYLSYDAFPGAYLKMDQKVFEEVCRVW